MSDVLFLIFCWFCLLNIFVWLDRYKDALVLLLREVLNRIQFRYNQAQLEELDDETLDDDVRTIYIYFCFSVTLYALCIACRHMESIIKLYYIISISTPFKTWTHYKGV